MIEELLEELKDCAEHDSYFEIVGGLSKMLFEYISSLKEECKNLKEEISILKEIIGGDGG